MEASVHNLLIDQVRDHLKTLPAKFRVRELIYNHFASQCDQYEINEDEFYKQILKSAFRDAEPAPDDDPDPENAKGTFVKVFGITLHSLKRLGEVLFDNLAREKFYFEDVTFLKTHVDSLEDADAAISYTKLYKSEKDPEKRYLKICYRLNPALPYRINGELFANVKELFEAGFKNKLLMDQIYQDYAHGKLHIWLHAQNAEAFAAQPGNKAMLSFLKLIYTVDPNYPFYIEQDLFDSPIELAAKAQINLHFRITLLNYCVNGKLFVWFNALGHPDWQEKFQKANEIIQQNNQIDDTQVAHALVEQLLYIIDPKMIRPVIAINETKIELLNLPAANTVSIPVKLQLKNRGLAEVHIAMQSAYEGIEPDTTHAFLFDLTGEKQVTVNLNINPQRLVKDKPYNTNLQIKTAYETLTIPILVKAVFPMHTYIIYLIRYAFFGAGVFAALRWIIMAATGHPGALSPQIITSKIERSLPDNWPVFFWTFLLMLSVLTGAYFAIRKVEKL